jgi:hypothetical protein
MDPENYLKKHTLMPIDRISAVEADQVVSYAIPKISHQNYRLLKVQEPAGFCKIYAQEDLKDYGFSYWRRIHQLYGIGWCLHHGAALQYSEHQEKFDLQPHMTKGDFSPSISIHIKNQGLLAYANLSHHLLNNPKRYHRKHISSVINTEGRRHGLQVSAHRRVRRISDLCREILPADWIDNFIPDLNTNPEGKYFPSLDGSCQSIDGVIGRNRLLAIAVPFCDSGRAIEALTSKSTGLQDQSKQRMLNFRDAYFLASGCPSKLRQELRSSKSQISGALKAQGLPPLRLVHDGTRERALSLLANASVEEQVKWGKLYAIQFEKLRVSGPSRAKRSAILSEMLDQVFPEHVTD